MHKINERIETYKSDTCWQYDIRVKNREEDLEQANLTEKDVEHLRVSDFVIGYEEKDEIFDEVKTFIERHEWLGRMGLYPTHFFTARYNGILAGVVIMDMPPAFSKLLGDKTKKLERLIARGACVSWSPKNLASALIGYGTKWMVKNTDYRLFTAYSDSEAGEIGTIYQACNFYYLGAKFGAKAQYQIENGRWVNDRYFRSRSVYKRIAAKLNITWVDAWQDKDRVMFDKMPEEVAEAIKTASKVYMASCTKRNLPQKGKYAYVLGRTKRETKELRKLFEERNKLVPYPKRVVESKN